MSRHSMRFLVSIVIVLLTFVLSYILIRSDIMLTYTLRFYLISRCCPSSLTLASTFPLTARDFKCNMLEG